MDGLILLLHTKNMKKILFITPLPPPVHGSAMVSQYIKDSQLVNGQFDCDFVNLSTSRRMDEIGKGGVKKLLRFIGAYFTLFWKLLTRHYDLCYLAITCHDKGFLKDAPFVLLCKLFGRRVVIHQHNKGMSGCVDRWPYRWLLPMVYRNTTVILLSWHLYPDIERVVKREQVVVCANGVPPLAGYRLQTTDDRQQTTDCHPEENTTHYTLHTKQNDENKDYHPEGTVVRSLLSVDSSNNDNDAAELQANSQAPSAKILFLSNLIPSKGVYVLLDACKVLKERGLQFVCDFVGGETKEISCATFEAAVRERGLEDVVRYHGPRYGEEKQTFFRNADVFVFPTFYYNECFPLVLLEAMQWRLPVVSSDEGGIPDIVMDGENGFVCRRNDALSLADALEHLITDSSLRQRMGERGYQRYREEYTLEVFERKIVECLIVSGGLVAK